jgi:hypothetical protein
MTQLWQQRDVIARTLRERHAHTDHELLGCVNVGRDDLSEEAENEHEFPSGRSVRQRPGDVELHTQTGLKLQHEGDRTLTLLGVASTRGEEEREACQHPWCTHESLGRM